MSMTPAGSCLVLAILAQTPVLAVAETMTLPRGTPIDVRIETDLVSEAAQEGEVFKATVLEPVYAEGRVLIPAGSTADGVVSVVKSRAGGYHSGVLGLRLVRLRSLDGPIYDIDGGLIGFRQRPVAGGDVTRVKASGKEAVVVIGDEAVGPGKRPSSLVGNSGESEDALAERWAHSGLSATLAEIAAGSEITFELRRPITVDASPVR